MLTGRDVMERAGILLHDDEHIRWPLPELMRWVNEAVDAILLAKPSASSATIVVALQQGTLQKVPTAGSPAPLRLMGLTRNILTDGAIRVAGRAVTATIRSLLDKVEPNWHDRRYLPYRREVRQFTFDEENPREFYVYPGNDGTGLIEAIVATRPPPLAATGPDDDLASYQGPVGLDDVYSGAIVDYVCYRAQQKDDEASNTGRAAIHYQNFATAIGIKIQVEGATSPNRQRRP